MSKADFISELKTSAAASLLGVRMIVDFMRSRPHTKVNPALQMLEKIADSAEEVLEAEIQKLQLEILPVTRSAVITAQMLESLAMSSAEHGGIPFISFVVTRPDTDMILAAYTGPNNPMLRQFKLSDALRAIGNAETLEDAQAIASEALKPEPTT